MLRRLRLSVALAVLMFSLHALTGSVCAQDIVGGAGRADLSGGAGISGGGGGGGGVRKPPRRPKPRNTGTTVKTAVRAKAAVATRTTGTLSVATEPGATILIEPVRGGAALEGTVEKDELQFIFNDLKPGRYRVAAELDGYTEDEKEVVVAANKTASVSLNLKLITHSVTIIANVPTGEVRYAPVTGIADASGQIKYNATGVTSVTPLQNGQATLSNLREGTYGVDVRSAEVGYKTLLATFTVPGKDTYKVTLDKRTSTKTFSANWLSLEAWETKAGWRVTSGKLSVSGRGVALPRDESYRYYIDFRLVSNVRMVNGIAASYAVRAVDDQNYYLIQITGAKADEPYVLRGFVVKNGVAQRFGSTIPVDGFTGTLKQNQFFSVLIEATGNKFKVSITDSQTGDVLPLGTLEDANRNFPIGAAGIAVRDNEQNEFERFVVCTSESSDCSKG
jgi:hypothetical protein